MSIFQIALVIVTIILLILAIALLVILIVLIIDIRGPRDEDYLDPSNNKEEK